jgi:hypothetical protein
MRKITKIAGLTLVTVSLGQYIGGPVLAAGKDEPSEIPEAPPLGSVIFVATTSASSDVGGPIYTRGGGHNHVTDEELPTFQETYGIHIGEKK